MKKQCVTRLMAAGMLLCMMTGCKQNNTVPQTVTVPNTTEASESEAESKERAESALKKETVPAETETETASEPETEEPYDEDMVRVQDYIPAIVVDLKYATEDNFTGTVIYDFTDAYLRYGTVKKLAEAEKMFEDQGMRIKIWDAYRPVYAQERLWEVYPDPVYVADPSYGITAHSRGDTIDCTLVYMDGSDVEMPTGFDDFSSMADRYYDDCSETAAANARMMEDIMYACGFTGYEGEWWDFSDTYEYWQD